MFLTLRIISGPIIVGTLVGTLISQLIISSLTGGKCFILTNCDFTSDGIVVRTVVGNVQTTIAIHKGQVTIAIKTTGMTSTQRNEVAMIDIVDRRCGIAEYRCSVGIDGGRT